MDVGRSGIVDIDGEGAAPGDRIRRFAYEELDIDLRELLRPRYERLGYLGEFFQIAANQPDALAGFVHFTEALRSALPDGLADLVALAAASQLHNRYEQNQHEQLALRNGHSLEWIAAAISSDARESKALTANERAVHRLVLALLRTGGEGAAIETDEVLDAFGSRVTVGIVLFVGRYAAHAILAHAARFTPPVPSVFDAPAPASPGDDR